jgi:hypothetical protein
LKNPIHLIYSSILHKSTSEAKNNIRDLLQQVTEFQTDFIKIQAHPLGFFALSWDLGEGKVLRIHIWSKAMRINQNPYWPIHDHIFSFSSLVLFGNIQNKVYGFRDSVRKSRFVQEFTVNYEGGRSVLSPTCKLGELFQIYTAVQPENSYYSLESGVLHRSILRSDFAVTALATQQSTVSSKPKVIGVAADSSDKVFDRTISSIYQVMPFIKKAISVL